MEALLLQPCQTSFGCRLLCSFTSLRGDTAAVMLSGLRPLHSGTAAATELQHSCWPDQPAE
jgi:hypothetical protein